MADAPKIDPRTAPDVAGQVRYFLEKYTGRKFEQADGASAALVNVFARYAELLIERLNKVPEKNFLAFLDLLGASPTPPQPARAPLTFTLSEGSTVDAVVPKGTQVAAAPAEGESEPATFETESELVVMAAQLTSIFVRDPENDRSADRSSQWIDVARRSGGGTPPGQPPRRRRSAPHRRAATMRSFITRSSLRPRVGSETRHAPSC